MKTNNSHVGRLINPSTIEGRKYESITTENTGRSIWKEAMTATTILSMPRVGKIKEEREVYRMGRKMSTLSIKEFVKGSRGISAKAGFYPFENVLIDIPIVVEEEVYDENFFIRQCKLLKEKDKFMSIDEI